ncbi:MAG: bacillithiol biosynthesis cysteine-adding enzyme BshC [Ignavibacteria bacterium]|jgi:bacillithiol biosynthesis cysteine-adding enzyme BshC
MKLQDVDRAFCEKRSRQGASRTRLAELVSQSMHGLDLSNDQARSLELLRSHETVVAVTGQQAGLFGGPMYTLCKIQSAVIAAADVTERTGSACIPVFWLEDNDHDAHEAMHTHLLVNADDIVEVSPWDKSNPRMRVADRRIDTSLHDAITDSIDKLCGRTSETTAERLRHAYALGASWSDAFLAVLAPYLSAWGVLVVRSSRLTDAGLHGPILAHLLDNNDAVVDAILSATAAITRSGGSAQASVADIPWMYTTADGRQRIEKTPYGVSIAAQDYTLGELHEMAGKHPERFTPTVLTRPMIQDAVLPTVVSILGAAELAYHEQLVDAYPRAGILMPALQRRSGLTILTAKSARNIGKSGHAADWYQRPWQQIERDIAAELTTELVPSRDVQQSRIEELFAPYLNAAESIDPTLIATVKAQRSGAESSLDTLEAKLRSAAKKKNAAMLDRAHAIHASVFPLDTLQERIYPLAMWESEFGIAGMLQICGCISPHAIGTHITTQAPVHGS